MTAFHVKGNVVNASVIFAPIVEEADDGIEKKEKEEKKDEELFKADMSIGLAMLIICEAAVQALLHSPMLHRLNYPMRRQQPPAANTW